MRKPKRLILTLVGLMAATGISLSVAGSADASAMSPSFTPCKFICPASEVVNYGSGECIEPVPGPDGNYAIDGLGIEQFTCAGHLMKTSQIWSMVPIGDAFVNGQTRTVYHIINWQSRQCLDDRDGRTSDRSPVQQWTCNDTSTTMQWVLGNSFNGAHQLMNMRAWQNGGSACLDVAGGSLQDGAVLQLYHCTFQNTAQAFSTAVG